MKIHQQRFAILSLISLLGATVGCFGGEETRSSVPRKGPEHVQQHPDFHTAPSLVDRFLGQHPAWIATEAAGTAVLLASGIVYGFNIKGVQTTINTAVGAGWTTLMEQIPFTTQGKARALREAAAQALADAQTYVTGLNAGNLIAYIRNNEASVDKDRLLLGYALPADYADFMNGDTAWSDDNFATQYGDLEVTDTASMANLAHALDLILRGVHETEKNDAFNSFADGDKPFLTFYAYLKAKAQKHVTTRTRVQLIGYIRNNAVSVNAEKMVRGYTLSIEHINLAKAVADALALGSADDIDNAFNALTDDQLKAYAYNKAIDQLYVADLNKDQLVRYIQNDDDSGVYINALLLGYALPEDYADFMNGGTGWVAEAFTNQYATLDINDVASLANTAHALHTLDDLNKPDAFTDTISDNEKGIALLTFYAYLKATNRLDELN